jgi:hypothetical protein
MILFLTSKKKKRKIETQRFVLWSIDRTNALKCKKENVSYIFVEEEGNRSCKEKCALENNEQKK